MVGGHRAWHDITAFGQHTQLNDVERGMRSYPLGSTHGRTTTGVARYHHPWKAHMVSNVGRHITSPALGSTHDCNVGGGMASPPLDSTHGQTTSGVACHHHPRTANTVERRQMWHAIIILGRQTRWNDVGRGMPSLPLGSTHGRTMSGVAFHQSSSKAHKTERHRA